MELSKYIVLLLPCYLDGFIWIFNQMGFAVVHAHDPEVLEAEIRAFDIDIALEWQHGAEDYPIRDLLRKCKREVPIFLSLNWNGRVPSDFSALGYQDYLKVPWKIDGLMRKFYMALPAGRKPVLKDLWEKAKKRCGE
jgi:hypothetical protein